MSQFALAAAFTVFVWWFGTGAILLLDGLPRRTFKWTLAGASVLLALALAGLAASSAMTTVGAAYCAFACAIVVWAWQEVAFLLGVVTGPRRLPCPPGAAGWRRAHYALQTVLHHEFALLALGALVYAIAAQAPNPTGWWTFVALYAMRQSAKLNVFLGVRNAGQAMLPAHLAYLGSYFARRSANALLPLSLALGTAATVSTWYAASLQPAGSFDAVSLALVGALLTLGLLEHVFLVLPLRLEALWGWALRPRREQPLRL
jgi:putative photosynthetic complex assembly protein 2